MLLGDKKISTTGGLVMVIWGINGFLQVHIINWSIKRLGLVKIIKKINDNSYEVILQKILDISPIFNVFDLYTFHVDVPNIDDI